MNLKIHSNSPIGCHKILLDPWSCPLPTAPDLSDSLLWISKKSVLLRIVYWELIFWLWKYKELVPKLVLSPDYPRMWLSRKAYWRSLMTSWQIRSGSMGGTHNIRQVVLMLWLIGVLHLVDHWVFPLEQWEPKKVKVLLYFSCVFCCLVWIFGKQQDLCKCSSLMLPIEIEITNNSWIFCIQNLHETLTIQFRNATYYRLVNFILFLMRIQNYRMLIVKNIRKTLN